MMAPDKKSSYCGRGDFLMGDKISCHKEAAATLVHIAGVVGVEMMMNESI